MKFKKGFTLAEMVAVIAILMVLALASTPFVKGYIDDSYFYKAKIFLRQLNEARLNFEKDYPGVRISGNLPMTEDDEVNCDLDSIYVSGGVIAPRMLVACHYLVVATDLNNRYQFDVGNSAECGDNPVAVSTLGLDLAGNYIGSCVGINADGEETENISN